MRNRARMGWWRQMAIAFWSAGMAVALNPSGAVGSERVIFTYGGLTQAVSLEELQTFAATGEKSPALKTVLKSGKQNPFVIRWILKQEFPADAKFVSDLLNTAPGEYVLSQTGNVVGTKTEKANLKALRGALIASASDNNLISLIEILENYPTRDVYVNGKILIRLRRNIGQLVEDTSHHIKTPLSFPQN
ncbi:MAG: alpha/beta hydrolase [Cyanobacteria bacterium P01_C01_bin.72]